MAQQATRQRDQLVRNGGSDYEIRDIDRKIASYNSSASQVLYGEEAVLFSFAIVMYILIFCFIYANVGNKVKVKET